MLTTHPKAHGGDPRPMAMHMSFLRRTFIGPAIFQVRDMKIGARTSTLHVALTQKDKKGEYIEEVVAYITITNFTNEDGPSQRFPFQLLPHDAPPPMPNFELLDSKRSDGAWVEFTPFRAKDSAPNASKQVEFFVPGTEKNSLKAFSKKGIAHEWVRFKPYGKLTN